MVLLSSMLDTIHPTVKLILIGLYIGWVGSIATLLASLIIAYLPIVRVPPFPIVNVACIACAFAFQELIRKTKLRRHLKVIIFGVTALLAGLAYVAFWAWAGRWFSWL